MSVTAMQAAKRACEASGWRLTNLQLQKILYIAYMVYAGREGRPKLIDDESFEAWDYGPVLPDVYRNVRSFGARPIKNVFHGVDDMPEGEEASIIDEAVSKLSGVAPFKLVEIVHDRHSAWARHYDSRFGGGAIPHEHIVEEYMSRQKGVKK
ncbi:Panacea domain-containing protein [Alcaligenes sp. YSL9]|uniref:Panacea domain-containing protein n=1 Tax=Alcaligenes sp. YSL9 TaxID=2939596 RepID=UPI00266C9C5F|nr:type II toxin-antitoxin system antitoxin SocA domain-containing protein [Alcaligenes sp. YSL9]